MPAKRNPAELVKKQMPVGCTRSPLGDSLNNRRLVLIVVSAVLAILWCLPNGVSEGETAQLAKPMFVFRGMAKSLTKAEKLAESVRLMKVNIHPTELTGFVELSVQKPFAQDSGYLDFFYPYEVHTKLNTIYGLPEPGSPAPYNMGFILYLHIQVARPNKPHMVTFYVDNTNPQDYVIEGASERQTQRLQRGLGAIPCIFIPKAAGDFMISFRPTTGAYNFNRVEIDIVD